VTSADGNGRRVRLPARLHDELSQWANTHGLDDDDALRLVLQAFPPLDEERARIAAGIVERLGRAEALTVEQLSLPDVDVLGVRLGGKRVDGEVVPGGLPPRPFVGADLGDSFEEAYSATRAYWRARAGAQYLVGLHVGYPLGVWKIREWATLPNGRIFVPDGAGARIETSNGKLLDPFTGAVIGEATTQDLEVARAVETVIFRFKQGSANPVIWLRRRS
jgi:hypothetical protein